MTAENMSSVQKRNKIKMCFFENVKLIIIMEDRKWLKL